jgi:cobalt-zinc-cadmium efflux system membrane fusion protein
MDLGAAADRNMKSETPVGAAETEHETPPRAGKGMPRSAQIGILIVVAGLVVLIFFVGPAAWNLIHPKTNEAATPEAAETAFKPTPEQWAGFKIAPVAVRTFSTTEETDGTIALDDDRNTAVYSPYSGRVAKLFAKAGDQVQQGQPLLAVEASEFVQGENDLVTAVSGLATARAQLQLAQTNERRQHDLFLANAGAMKDWQQSQVDLATAQGNTNTAEIALGAVRNRLRILGKTDKEITALESSRNMQSFNPSSVVVSPIAGTVTQRQVGLGQYIVNQSNGGSTPVFSIGDLSHVWLVANVREADAPLVHLGDPVEVGVLAYPRRVFKAHVIYVAPAIDPNTHRLTVRAEVENPDLALKPSMFASFRIVSGNTHSSPAVPDSAVVYEGEKARVFVADPAAKTIAIREIRVGRIEDGVVEVDDGLKADDHIVTSGSLFIDRAIQGD